MKAMMSLFVFALIAQVHSGIAVNTYGGLGSDVLKNCSAVNRLDDSGSGSPDDALKATACYSYASGIIDAHELQTKIGSTQGPYCIPDHVTINQIAKVISVYGSNHPEKLHETALIVVTMSLIQAFPCSS